MNQENSKLIFFHIPKTAGSTLRNIFYHQYEREEVFEMKVKGHQIQTQEFTSLSQKRIAKIRLLMGHMPFGLHTSFGEVNYHYFTMLRNPVERVISNYYWIRRNPNHLLYDLINSKKIGLLEFIESDLNPSLNNGYVKFLTTKDKKKKVTDKLFNEALSLLKQEFIVVGITERFNESIILLSKLMNWQKRIFYTKQNATANRPQITDIDNSAIQSIISKNEWDLKLYVWAEKQLEKQIKEYGEIRMSVNCLKVRLNSNPVMRRILAKV